MRGVILTSTVRRNPSAYHELRLNFMAFRETHFCSAVNKRTNAPHQVCGRTPFRVAFACASVVSTEEMIENKRMQKLPRPMRERRGRRWQSTTHRPIAWTRRSEVLRSMWKQLPPDLVSFISRRQKPAGATPIPPERSSPQEGIGRPGEIRSTDSSCPTPKRLKVDSIYSVS